MDNNEDVSFELFKGQPLLKYENKKVIFSPYQRCFAEIQGFDLKDIESRLPHGFFGCPANLAENDGTVNIGLILTRRCNLQCKYCVAHTNIIQNDISKNIITDSLSSVMNQRKPKELCVKLSGGEPTQNPDAIEWVLEELSKYKCKKNLIIGTNGVIERPLLEHLVENNFSFHISLDGTPEINDYNRPLRSGGQSTTRTLETIEFLIRHEVAFKVRSIITSESVTHMVDFVDFFAAKGIKYVSFGTLGECEISKRNNFLAPDPRKYVKYFMDALDRAEELGLSLEVPMHISLFNPAIHFCPNIPGKEIIITNEGNISRCWFVLDEIHPFAELFLIGKYDASKRAFIEYGNRKKTLDSFSVSLLKECDTCFAKFLCAGGCRARHLAACSSSNLASISDYYCSISKEFIKKLIIRLYKESLNTI